MASNIPSDINVRKLTKSDADEFRKLRDTVKRPIHSKLKKDFGSLLSEEDIEDIHSDVMLEELVSIRNRKYKIPEGGTPEGRAIRKAVWKAKDFLRARRGKGPRLAEDDTRPSLVSHDDPQVAQAESRHLSTNPPSDTDEEEQVNDEEELWRQAFDSLSEEDKSILQSSIGAGLSAREIGEKLGISRDAAQQRIVRAKERAKRRLRELGKEEMEKDQTKEGDPLKLLGDMLRAGKMPPTEEEVQKLMREMTVEVSQASLDRAHKKFVDKVFGYLHPHPVRNIRGRETFGLWLEARRIDAVLTREDIAEVLGKDESYVERLEIGEASPLSLEPTVAADIAVLFRIHIEGIAQLVSNSEAIRGNEIKVPIPSDVMKSAKEQAKSSDDSLVWLGALYEELERRQATHLLL